MNINRAHGSRDVPVGQQTVEITRFVYNDGSIQYRLRPLSLGMTPEHVMEVVLNGLGLAMHTNSEFTNDTDGRRTYNAVKTGIRRMFETGYTIALLWERIDPGHDFKFKFPNPEPPRV